MNARPRPEPEASELHRDRVKRAIRARTRVEAVRLTGLIESALTVPTLNRAARLAARAMSAPIAQINLISDTAFVPIAAYADAAEPQELWRAQRQPGNSFCKHIIWSKEPFRVENAHEDPLVRHGRATRELGVLSYLGVPVHAPIADAGRLAVVGTVCVMDRVARTWSDDELITLCDMAVGISDFIATRVRAHAEVRQGDQQLARVLEGVRAAVISVDGNGVITYANGAATQMLGYSSDDLVGRNRHELIHHSRADGGKYLESECAISRARATGLLLDQPDDVIWRSDGSPVMVDSSVSPVFDRGEIVGAVLTFVDVAERKTAEETERRARHAAEAASRAKTELLHAMSDELRAPLREIGEQSVRLERGLADARPEQLSDVHAIQRSQAHLLGLVDNMAGFANIGDSVIKDAR